MAAPKSPRKLFSYGSSPLTAQPDIYKLALELRRSIKGWIVTLRIVTAVESFNVRISKKCASLHTVHHE